MVAEELSRQFNCLSPGPPKKVGFVPVVVMEMVDRPGKPLFNVEPLLKGSYEKHNDNDGGIFTRCAQPNAAQYSESDKYAVPYADGWNIEDRTRAIPKCSLYETLLKHFLTSPTSTATDKW